MIGAAVDDRLAGSYPYCTMMAVMTSGWLMLKQQRAAQAMLDAGEGNAEFLKAKLVTTRFYLERMVPEAGGLKAAAMAGAELLYALDAEALAG